MAERTRSGEQVTGIEPVIPAWQPSVSPQHFTCRETARDRAGESRGAEDGNRTRDPGTADRCVTSTLHLRGAGGRGAGRRLAPRLGGDRRPSRSEGGASRALDRSVVIRGAARPAAGARSWGATSGDGGTVADRAWRRFLASFGARTASRGARAWSHPPGLHRRSDMDALGGGARRPRGGRRVSSLLGCQRARATAHGARSHGSRVECRALEGRNQRWRYPVANTGVVITRSGIAGVMGGERRRDRSTSEAEKQKGHLVSQVARRGQRPLTRRLRWYRSWGFAIQASEALVVFRRTPTIAPAWTLDHGRLETSTDAGQGRGGRVPKGPREGCEGRHRCSPDSR